MSESRAYKSHTLAVCSYPGDDDFWKDIQAGLIGITQVRQQKVPRLSLPF